MNKKKSILILTVTMLTVVITFFFIAYKKPVAEVVFLNYENLDKYYDVIVVGGEPEGVTAAVSAARNGVKTLLLEDDSALGGLMTLGGLNFIDMNYSRDGILLTRGIFEEFYDLVGGSAFDITLAKNTFLKMVTDQPNITLRLGARTVSPILKSEEGITPEVIGIKVLEAGQEVSYFAPCIIDATADADFAAMSGVPYTFSGEDILEKNRQMGATLIFELSDVNWLKVYSHLNWQRLKGEISNKSDTSMGATPNTAWGYGEEGYSYQPVDTMIKLRGFNIARQNDGNVLVNALIIFGTDVLDENDKAKSIERAKKELEYIIPYINKNFKGFENAKLVRTAEQLYVRESRHIIGEYQLTIDDVLESRDQWDKIAVGSYPVDVQPTIEQQYGTVVGSPDRYAIPFRSLVPLGADNLLVIGRSASYTSLAAGSARVIPIGMVEGQAAGVAAAYSVNNDINFRDISKSEYAINEIQRTLKSQGAYLENFILHESFMDHWAYPQVKVLRRLGLLDGGYNNDYNLEQSMGKWQYQNIINGVLKKAGITIGYIEVNENPPNRQIIGTIARAAAMQIDIKNPNDYNIYMDFLFEQGIMTESLKGYFNDEGKNPQVAEVVVLCGNLYDWIAAQK